MHHPCGLHNLDLLLPEQKEILMAMTLEKQYKGYTRHQIDGAIKAHRLQGMIGHPSQREFDGRVHEQMIRSCPVTPYDVTNAYKLFGPGLAGIREKNS